MIFVIDNGCPYSDHRIYFVTTEYSRHVMQQVCEVCSAVRGRFKILAMAEKIEWMGLQPMQAHELLTEIVYDFEDSELVDKIEVLPPELLLQAGKPPP